jgi:glycerol-3-phosphate dehydrogenase (NAD(P)+)
VGIELGRELDEIVAGMSEVAEGVRTTGAAIELARRFGVEMPIAEAVQGVLEEEIAPEEAANRLMRSQLRPENE